MLRDRLRGILVVVAMMALAGCATDRSIGTSSQIEVTELTALPAPETNGYAFAAQDSVDVRVRQDPTLDGTYLLDENGNLDFPMVGLVAARGLSSTQLAELIESRLANGYINNPDVFVAPTEAVPLTISVGGEVAQPGNYPIANSQTLMRAVNSAGGMSEFAAEDDVLVFRTVGGQRYIGLYNMGAIQRGNYPDPAIYSGDIVMVGNSPARQRLDTLLTFVPILSTVVVLLDRLSN